MLFTSVHLTISVSTWITSSHVKNLKKLGFIKILIYRNFKWIFDRYMLSFWWYEYCECLFDHFNAQILSFVGTSSSDELVHSNYSSNELTCTQRTSKTERTYVQVRWSNLCFLWSTNLQVRLKNSLMYTSSLNRDILKKFKS